MLWIDGVQDFDCGCNPESYRCCQGKSNPPCEHVRCDPQQQPFGHWQSQSQILDHGRDRVENTHRQHTTRSHNLCIAVFRMPHFTCTGNCSLDWDISEHVGPRKLATNTAMELNSLFFERFLGLGVAGANDLSFSCTTQTSPYHWDFASKGLAAQLCFLPRDEGRTHNALQNPKSAVPRTA